MPTIPTIPNGYRWSASVLAKEFDRSGLGENDANAVLARAARHDDGDRYLNRSELRLGAQEARSRPVGAPPAYRGSREVGYISDLDRTIIPPHEDTLPPAAYPGVAQLLHEIEFADGGKPGDAHYVTARTPERVTELPAWLAARGVPAGDVATGRPGFGAAPAVARPEKVKDIEAILAANPGQRFVLLGDTHHVDPDVYRDVIARHPDRIVAAFVHSVRAIDPQRLVGLHPFDNYAQVAAELHRMAVLDEAAARRVIGAARAQGLALSDAEVDALFAAQG